MFAQSALNVTLANSNYLPGISFVPNNVNTGHFSDALQIEILQRAPMTIVATFRPTYLHRFVHSGRTSP